MAGISKKTTNDKPEYSKDDILKKYDETKNSIRSILGKYRDRRDMRPEDKQKLCSEYLRAADFAKKLSKCSVEAAEIEEYATNAKKFEKAAKEYGSNVSYDVPDTTFDDVKGLDDVKKLIESFIFLAEHPEVVSHYKIEGGLGILMYGAPGTGKTMFAEAIANRLRLPLFVITPADIFKSYVGESEQAVRQLFEEMDACADGAILFVDECESIFSKRTSDTKDYKAAVTTELLQRINGFGVEGSRRVIIAATNRPEIIDSAYLRFKRFSHRIHIPPPDREAELAIVESKLKGIDTEVSPTELVDMLENRTLGYNEKKGRQDKMFFYSAADICGIVEEACRLAVDEVRKSGNPKNFLPLTREMFESAVSGSKPSISLADLDFYKNF